VKEVFGPLERDAVWTGDVLLTGDVVVPEGATLRVLPGAKIRAAAKPRWSCAVFRCAPEGWPIEASEREACDLVVLGTLIMDGAIVSGGPWGGITLLKSARAQLNECSFQARAPFAVQSFDDSRAELRRCSLSNCRIGLWSFGLSRVNVVGGSIIAEQTGALACEGGFIALRGVDVKAGDQAVRQEGYADVVAR
jgi:hypothetical protein